MIKFASHSVAAGSPGDLGEKMTRLLAGEQRVNEWRVFGIGIFQDFFGP